MLKDVFSSVNYHCNVCSIRRRKRLISSRKLLFNVFALLVLLNCYFPSIRSAIIDFNDDVVAVERKEVKQQLIFNPEPPQIPREVYIPPENRDSTDAFANPSNSKHVSNDKPMRDPKNKRGKIWNQHNSQSGSTETRKSRNTKLRRRNEYPRVNGRRYIDIPLDEKEKILAYKEIERTAVLWRSLKAQGYELYGFYHTSTWQPYWKEVLTEQLQLLDGRRRFPTKANLAKNITNYALYELDEGEYYTSLLGMSDGMYLNVAVKAIEEFHDVKNFIQTLNLRYYYKILFNYNFTIYRDDFVEDPYDFEMKCGRDREISCGEFSTYQSMRGFCRNFVRESDMDSYGITDPEERRRFPLQEEAIDIQYNGKYGHNMPADMFKKRIPGWEEERNADYFYYRESEKANDNTNPGEESDTLHFQSTDSEPAETELTKKKSGRYGLGTSEYPRDNKRRAMIFYFHLKGSSLIKDLKDLSIPAPPSLWRQYMGAFNLEFPSICMRAIGKYGYSICGTEYKPYEQHFSGNFWWTDCEHLAQLLPLKIRFDCFEAEYNNVNIDKNSYHNLAYAAQCAYNMLFVNVSEGLNFKELPREVYFPRLWELVLKKNLLPSDIQTLKPVKPGKFLLIDYDTIS